MIQLSFDLSHFFPVKMETKTQNYKCFLLLLSFHLSTSEAAKITFYEHSNGKGDSITVERYDSSCYNFGGDWNDRISSVDTHDNCIIAWEHGSCSGRSERIAPGTQYHGHLAGIDFNDVISSFNLCSNDEGQPPTNPPSANDLWRVAVDEHNRYRRRHGVPDIRGDDAELHRTAQEYAEYLAANNKFEHSGNKYGENLAANGGPTKQDAIRVAVGDQWYSEEKKYDYNRPGFSMETGHFTAVVWKKTTHVGIGVAYDPKANWFVVVANYNPAGNSGGYEENVPRPIN